MRAWRVMVIITVVASLLVGAVPSFAQRSEYVVVTLAPEEGVAFDAEALQQVADVIEQRLAAFDVEVTVDGGYFGSDEIFVIVPADQYSAALLPLMTTPALLEFVDLSMIEMGEIEENTCILTTEQVLIAESLLPEGEEPLAYADYTCASGDDRAPEPALLNAGEPFQTIMTGDGLLDAASFTWEGSAAQYGVSFTLRPEGDRVDAFLDYIANNANHAMAIVLDGRVMSYPRIDAGLSASARAGTMDSGVISGSFTQEEARVLAAQLSYGALPLPLVVVSVK